jgi:hypothetical protein
MPLLFGFETFAVSVGAGPPVAVILDAALIAAA